MDGQIFDFLLRISTVQHRIRHAVREIAFCSVRSTGLMPVARALFAGRGVILMFHEIQGDPAHELMSATSAPFLDYILSWLKSHGWEIVSLDDWLNRLMGIGPSGRFVILTFDDGYRDNALLALPILERHNAPFTLFVPTGAPTGTLYSWWLGLRDLFRRHESVAIEAMGRRFDCPDLPTKIAALTEVERWVHQDFRRKEMLKIAFDAAGVSFPALNKRYFLNEQELQELSRHPLACVGAHTSSHAALATLDRETARREMADNRVYLEQLIQRPVRHFAYPYGEPSASGAREVTLAAELGFATAVTTRHGQLLKEHANTPCALPRIGVTAHDTPTSFIAKMSGLEQAMRSMLGAIAN
jgi:peptidoglycan/xylan/chitin deacetylase (PgdA/CDA1 family)